MSPSDVTLVECPRDAMQGIQTFIPTDLKIQYLKALLNVGFHTLDFGSFVSPKAIPQLADTQQVLSAIESDALRSETRLLAIVANEKGAQEAIRYPLIRYLGFPFSVSETFQLRNTKQTIAQAWDVVRSMQDLCLNNQKELVVYLSMGFGNPYGDDWSVALLETFADQMVNEGITILSLADTLGNANPQDVRTAFETLTQKHPQVTFGAHFHATPSTRRAKIEAAWDGGCRRFDSALMGFGGCPYADDELVGNIATEDLLAFLKDKQALPPLNADAMSHALTLAPKIFAH